MTTTFNPAIDLSSHRSQRQRPRGMAIIVVLLGMVLALPGCGFALKFGYGQGPSLALAWLDGYVDFDDNQSLRLRTSLDEWFIWHRRTQLPDYAELLGRAQSEVAADSSAEKMCGWSKAIRGRLDTALERATPMLADAMLTISPMQVANIERKYAENNGKYRDDYLQKDPAKRRRAAVDREVERAERLYGRLDATQRELVVRSLQASPFEAEASYAERLRRQQDVVAVLKRLQGTRAGRSDAENEIRAYAQRVDRSPREDYRRYADRLADHNCAFAAQLHNATTAEQRRTAASRLKSWEDDLRGLASEGT